VNRAQMAIVTGALALVGAVLAFALADDGTSVAGVKLRSLGLILLVAGGLALAGLWLNSVQAGTGEGGSGGGNQGTTGIRAVSGLIAVVSGIVAVSILSGLALTRFGSSDKASIVAVTTSAFGIISAVVGAYLGIKTASGAAIDSQEAVLAKHDAAVSQQKVTRLQEVVDDKLSDSAAAEILATAARKKPDPPDPPPSGRPA
jgi:hypothetical protein